MSQPPTPAEAIEAAAATRANLRNRRPPWRDEHLRDALATLSEAMAPVRRRLTVRSWSLPDRADADALSRERVRVQAMLRGRGGNPWVTAAGQKARAVRRAERRARSRDGLARYAKGEAEAVAQEVESMAHQLDGLPPWEAIPLRGELAEELERVHRLHASVRYVRGESAVKARTELQRLDRLAARALSPRPAKRRGRPPGRVWTVASARAALDGWASEHGRSPSTSEIDGDPSLPSASTVYRKLGSLPREGRCTGCWGPEHAGACGQLAS